MADQYTIPPELSSILATLAQFAPQIQSATSAPSQVDPIHQDTHTPPGVPPPQIQPYQSYFPNAITTTALPAQNPVLQQEQRLAAQPPQQPQQQHQPYQPPPRSLDPRLANRSRTQTPDIATLSYQSSVPNPSTLQQHNLAYSQSVLPDASSYQHQQGKPFDPRLNLQSSSLSRSVTPSLPNGVPNGDAGAVGGQGWGGLVIDPASITEWTAGLRCVNKIAVQNREFVAAIRKLISNQQKHEMQWYQGRQEMKQTQARRVTGATEIQNILGSLGGTNTFSNPKPPATTQQSQEEKDAELAAFDAKVYRAQLLMHDAMSAELKSLGVPFFGTDWERIIPDDSDGAGAGGNDGKAAGAQAPKWSPKITKAQLLALQRRMIGHLEDMYKE